MSGMFRVGLSHIKAFDIGRITSQFFLVKCVDRTMDIAMMQVSKNGNRSNANDREEA